MWPKRRWFEFCQENDFLKNIKFDINHGPLFTLIDINNRERIKIQYSISGNGKVVEVDPVRHSNDLNVVKTYLDRLGIEL